MRVLATILVVAVVAVAVSAIPNPREEEVASFKLRVRRSENPSDEKQIQVRVKRQGIFSTRSSVESYSSENRDNDIATGTAVLIKAGVMSLIIKGIIAAILGSSMGGDAMTTTT